MKNFTKLGLSVAICAGFVISAVFAEGNSNEKIAKEMLKKGLEHYKQVGEEQALKDFNDPNGDYRKGTIYLYCVSYKDNKVSSHPVTKALVGMDFTIFRDVDGKPFGKEILEQSKANGSGYYDYKWTMPDTNKIANKRVYYEKFSDSQVCVVNVYQ